MVFAELYIVFDLMAFFIFIYGIEKDKLIYPMMAFFMFLTLGVAGFNITSMFTNDVVYSVEATAINFGFGMISFVYMMYTYFKSLKVLEGSKEGDVLESYEKD